MRNKATNHLKEILITNGTGAGAVGLSEIGSQQWMGMSEAFQSIGTTGIVIAILIFNVGKTIQLFRQMAWENADRERKKNKT